MRPELYRQSKSHATNVHPIVKGSIGELKNRFIHHSFNSGLKRWFQKHTFTAAAKLTRAGKFAKAALTVLRKATNADTMSCRRSLKNLSYFLKARGLDVAFHPFVHHGSPVDGSTALPAFNTAA